MGTVAALAILMEPVAALPSVAAGIVDKASSKRVEADSLSGSSRREDMDNLSGLITEATTTDTLVIGASKTAVLGCGTAHVLGWSRLLGSLP